jgi:hypothetical protein
MILDACATMRMRQGNQEPAESSTGQPTEQAPRRPGHGSHPAAAAGFCESLSPSTESPCVQAAASPALDVPAALATP